MSGAVLGIGSAISAYGSYEGGVQKQQAYEFEASSKRAQAAQIQIGADRQTEVLGRQYEVIHGAQVSAYGHSGVSATSGSPLLAMEQTKANAMERIQAVNAAALYNKNTVLQEGAQDQVLGNQAYNAGVMGVFTSMFGAVSKNPYSYDQPSSAVTSGGGGSGYSVGSGMNTNFQNVASF